MGKMAHPAVYCIVYSAVYIFEPMPNPTHNRSAMRTYRDIPEEKLAAVGT